MMKDIAEVALGLCQVIIEKQYGKQRSSTSGRGRSHVRQPGR